MNDAVMTRPVVTLTPKEVATMQENFRQRDAIFAFEGFEPTAQRRAIDAALLAGRVTITQVSREMEAYANEHKTTEGFIESRPWRLPA
jgi:hypothetical protein